MLNILIVDDSLSNQLVLESLLENYAEEHGAEFSVDVAMNGKDAIDHCEAILYDIIFMDIMMPIMNGIDATEIIHKSSPSTIIVAVSALNDVENEKKILRAGAEDYIHKPINQELFISRLLNYISLINFRKSKALACSAGVHNCINKNIYTRKTNFDIFTEDNLAEFWEYYLMDHQGGKELVDLIRTFHEIGILALSKKIFPKIWVEYTKDSTYFTMAGLENISEQGLRKLLKTHIENLQSRIVENVFTVVISNQLLMKSNTPIEDEVVEQQVITQVATIKENEQIIAPAQPQETPVKVEKHSGNRVFNYMSDEDLLDIKEYLAKLNSLLIVVAQGDVEYEEVVEIASYLDAMSKISTMYSESYSIGMALSNFSREIFENIEIFQEKSSSLGQLCIAFGQDIREWIRLIFEDGAPSVNCMDESIIFNSLMLCQMLNDTASSTPVLSIDDIFDF